VNEPCRKQDDSTIGGRKDGKMEKWNFGKVEFWIPELLKEVALSG